jgi:myo-inositol catabolism protein IolS
LEYIKIKNSDLNVSRICIGGCPMGMYGWGKTNMDDLTASVQAAFESGINFFDTAATYGLGVSETILGKALGKNRSKVVISDKFGVRAEQGKPTVYDNSKEYIISACEESLKRLGTDYIDIYTVHYRDGVTPLAEVVQTLETLRSQGKIRYFALSNVHACDMDEIRECSKYFVSVQNEYSLACRRFESELLAFRDECGLTPFTWGSLGQGILSGKYNESNVDFGADDRRSRDIYVNFHGEKLKQNLETVKVLRQISQKVNKPVSAVAIRFIMDRIRDSVVLIGVKNPNQVHQNVAASDWHLSDEDMQALLAVSAVD